MYDYVSGQTMKDLTNLFKALADETRLRIINLLLERELCVCELVDILEMSQPRISRHLNILLQTGLLHNRREGKWMHYSIEKELPDYYETFLDGVRTRLSQTEVGRIDLEKIKNISGKAGKPCP
ncbi:MAG: metalloregulator ArsR/SmtB family transcription factor [bacterium]|nr:metalloregulator ArsR/SmtB family transcription factor [bacterium]